MFKKSIFYNENSYCNSCMKCVNSCQLKAIKFAGGLPEIIDDLCVNCGSCYDNCPTNTIHFINTTEFIKNIIRTEPVVIASLSPTWVSEFPDITKSGMITLLKELGFTYVSETTHGAAEAIKETVTHIKSGAKLTISSLCPAINSTVIKYYPHLTPYLAPVDFPAVAHAKLLRKEYGNDIKVVAISSCVADKIYYYDNPRELDAAITFKELKKWFDDRYIDYTSEDYKDLDELKFEPFDAEDCHDYIFPSGATQRAIINAGLDVTFVSFTGMETVVETLDNININKLQKQTFIGLMACKNGNFSTSGSVDKGNNVNKLIHFKECYKSRYTENPRRMTSVNVQYKYLPQIINKINDADYFKINEIIETLNITSNGKHINCGRCGYPSCREFARAVSIGMTDMIYCIPYYQNSLRRDIRRIIENQPFATFIVDERLNITSSNTLFQEAIGMPLSKNGRLSSNEIRHFINFADDISKMFSNKVEKFEKDVISRGKLMHVTLFTLEGGRYICGIMRNLTVNNVLSEEIITKTRKVISDNIESVQQIAYMLGENAARTESLLNSIIATNNKEE